MKKKAIIALSAAVVLVIASVLELNWQLWGYSRCTEPNDLVVKSADIADGRVRISGTTLNSAQKFQGYRVEYHGETMYVGLKYSIWFGKNGDFIIDEKASDDDSSKDISKIVIKGAKSEKQIMINK